MRLQVFSQNSLSDAGLDANPNEAGSFPSSAHRGRCPRLVSVRRTRHSPCRGIPDYENVYWIGQSAADFGLAAKVVPGSAPGMYARIPRPGHTVVFEARKVDRLIFASFIQILDRPLIAPRARRRDRRSGIMTFEQVA